MSVNAGTEYAACYTMLQAHLRHQYAKDLADFMSAIEKTTGNDSQKRSQLGGKLKLLQTALHILDHTVMEASQEEYNALMHLGERVKSAVELYRAQKVKRAASRAAGSSHQPGDVRTLPPMLQPADPSWELPLDYISTLIADQRTRLSPVPEGRALPAGAQQAPLQHHQHQQLSGASREAKVNPFMQQALAIAQGLPVGAAPTSSSGGSGGSSKNFPPLPPGGAAACRTAASLDMASIGGQQGLMTSRSWRGDGGGSMRSGVAVASRSWGGDGGGVPAGAAVAFSSLFYSAGAERGPAPKRPAAALGEDGHADVCSGPSEGSDLAAAGSGRSGRAKYRSVSFDQPRRLRSQHSCPEMEFSFWRSESGTVAASGGGESAPHQHRGHSASHEPCFDSTAPASPVDSTPAHAGPASKSPFSHLAGVSVPGLSSSQLQQLQQLPPQAQDPTLGPAQLARPATAAVAAVGAGPSAGGGAEAGGAACHPPANPLLQQRQRQWQQLLALRLQQQQQAQQQTAQAQAQQPPAQHVPVSVGLVLQQQAQPPQSPFVQAALVAQWQQAAAAHQAKQSQQQPAAQQAEGGTSASLSLSAGGLSVSQLLLQGLPRQLSGGAATGAGPAADAGAQVPGAAPAGGSPLEPSKRSKHDSSGMQQSHSNGASQSTSGSGTSRCSTGQQGNAGGAQLGGMEPPPLPSGASLTAATARMCLAAAASAQQQDTGAAPAAFLWVPTGGQGEAAVQPRPSQEWNASASLEQLLLQQAREPGSLQHQQQTPAQPQLRSFSWPSLPVPEKQNTFSGTGAAAESGGATPRLVPATALAPGEGLLGGVPVFGGSDAMDVVPPQQAPELQRSGGSEAPGPLYTSGLTPLTTSTYDTLAAQLQPGSGVQGGLPEAGAVPAPSPPFQLQPGETLTSLANNSGFGGGDAGSGAGGWASPFESGCGLLAQMDLGDDDDLMPSSGQEGGAGGGGVTALQQQRPFSSPFGGSVAALLDLGPAPALMGDGGNYLDPASLLLQAPPPNVLQSPSLPLNVLDTSRLDSLLFELGPDFLPDFDATAGLDGAGR